MKYKKKKVYLIFILQPAFFSLNEEMTGKPVVISGKRYIREFVTEVNKYKKEKLGKSLKGCFVFIKMDPCTHHRLNYFATDARFGDENNQMIAQILGVADITTANTSGS